MGLGLWGHGDFGGVCCPMMMMMKKKRYYYVDTIIAPFILFLFYDSFCDTEFKYALEQTGSFVI